MELANLEVAVIYKKNFLRSDYHIMKYLPSKKDAEVFINEYENGNEKEIERIYKIEIMPLFEVLNSLLAENNELREKIESVEEKLNR